MGLTDILRFAKLIMLNKGVYQRLGSWPVLWWILFFIVSNSFFEG